MQSSSTAAATRRLLPVVMLDLIAFGIVLPLLPAAGARYETHAVLIGALVALDSCFAFLLAPWWGRLSDRIGRRPVILIGLAGSALGYGLFAVAPSFLVLLLSRAVTGMTSTTFGVAQAALADMTTPERRARAMGLLGAAFGVGFTVGPAIGGIAGRLDDGLPALVAAAIAAGTITTPAEARQGFLDRIAAASLARLDYFEIVDSATLETLRIFAGHEPRLIAAAFFGKTRLIDNVGLPRD